MSIKLSDLRLGNWVTLDRDKPFKITCSSFALFERLNIEVSDYLPIPLTPEILIKAGFELLPRSRAMYRIFLDDIEVSVSLEFFFAYIDTPWGQAPIKKPIFKYVHSLQNLIFSLTGKEIELNTMSI